MSEQVLARLAEFALVPVIEIADPDLAVPLADALVEGGLPCAEITFRTDGAAAALAKIAQERADVLVAAGTILSTSQVDRALDAGARLLVSPGFNPTVVEYALKKGATILPGVCTPTEIEMARLRGIDTVKFFPAEAAGGVPYLKALTAPYHSVRFVPTGGIDDAKLEAYLAVRQVVAVGGSWMAPPDLIRARAFEEIARRTHAAVEVARRLRPSLDASPAAHLGGEH